MPHYKAKWRQEASSAFTPRLPDWLCPGQIVRVHDDFVFRSDAYDAFGIALILSVQKKSSLSWDVVYIDPSGRINIKNIASNDKYAFALKID